MLRIMYIGKKVMWTALLCVAFFHTLQYEATPAQLAIPQELQNVDVAWSLALRLKFSQVVRNMMNILGLNYGVQSSVGFRDVEKWVIFDSLCEKMTKNNKIFALVLLIDHWSNFLSRNWFIHISDKPSCFNKRIIFCRKNYGE